jgi:ubiquinone/menaquinone biosynthesis C-methylase UbiE
LSFFKSKKNVKLFGIDPSQNVIEEANKNGITAKVGTADLLDFNDDKFDIVIFGFYLYLCDRKDLFKIASEANRV